MEALRLTTITPVLAAQLLRGMASADPSGMTAEEGIPGMARRGECLLATDAEGDQAVVVLAQANGVVWVNAARAVGGQGWCAPLLEAIERRAEGARAVAFQTARPGLARQAQKHGYTVAGYILKKDLT